MSDAMSKHFQKKFNGRLICHKCAYIKSPTELVNYGRYRLCLDCAHKFEILIEKDRTCNIDDFVIAD
jgi:hypothetical protein